MAYEQRANTGAIFKNDKRDKDTQPQMKGSALVDGKEYWVSAWTNESEAGVKYQSLAFTLKEEQVSAPARPSGSGFDETDIPF
jgi:hypothetical protein